MLLGKRYDECTKEEQIKFRSKLNWKQVKFAWVPVKLVDGRWLFFGKYTRTLYAKEYMKTNSTDHREILTKLIYINSI